MADGYCNYCLNRGFCENACADYNDYLADMGKLRLYEQTGLTPDEITDHEEMFKAYRAVCSGLTPEQCAELAKAEGEGRLVYLPAVSDKMYYLTHMASQGGRLALRNTGDGSGIVKRREIRVFFENYTGSIPLKHIFRTRAEAENYLREGGE